MRPEDVPAEEIEREASVLKSQAMAEGKPAEIADLIVKALGFTAIAVGVSQ